MLNHMQEFAVAWRGPRLAALTQDVSPFLPVPERRRTLGLAIKDRFMRPLGEFRISGLGSFDVVLRGFKES